MIKRKWLTLFTLPVVVSGFITIAPAAASTSDTQAASASSVAPPIVGDGYVIVNPASAVETKGATFYPTGPLGSDTLVVIANPDGTLPGGITTAGLQSLVAQIQAAPSSAAAAAPVASVTPASAPAKSNAASTAASTRYGWSATSGGYGAWSTGQSVIGMNWSTKVRYSFYTAEGFAQTAAGQGIGHYRGYNGSTFGVWTKAYGLGLATSSGGGASVPWGMVMDNMRFHARCTVTTFCWGDFYW